MKNLFLIVSVLFGVSFGIDKIVIPVDFDTATTGKKGYLADNYEEIEEKTNYLIDSTQQIRDVLTNYLTDLTVTSQESFIVQLDADTSGIKSFIVLSDSGDTLFRISEDGTSTMTGTVSVDSLNVSGAIINSNGTITADTITVSVLTSDSLDVSGTITSDTITASVLTSDSLDVSGTITADTITASVLTSDSLNVSGATINQNGKISADSLDISGTTINENGTITTDTINIGSTTALTNFSVGDYNELYFSGTGINSEGNIPNDAGVMWLNYHGYVNGTTYYRDVRIGDGKENTIAHFDGSALTAAFKGNTEVEGDFVVDTTTFFVDQSEAKVGIGTASPDELLHIENSAPKFRIEDSDGGYGFVSASSGNFIINADGGNTQADSRIEFRLDGSDFIRIQDDKIGIMTNSPQALLHTSGGGTTFSPGANTQAIFEDTTQSEISIISGGSSIINFGDYSSETIGRIVYDHNLDALRLNAEGSDGIDVYGDLSYIHDSLQVGGSVLIDSNLTVTGDYIDLPVKTTTGDPTGAEGRMYVNTQDNKVRVYADGAWRDLATW